MKISTVWSIITLNKVLQYKNCVLITVQGNVFKVMTKFGHVSIAMRNIKEITADSLFY